MATASGYGLVLHAASFAALSHINQRRKNINKSPYINHPIEVADLIMRVGKEDSPVILAAALLHDVVEDTQVKIEEIDEMFGKEVGSLVRKVTDDKRLTKVERKKAQVRNTLKKSHGVALIKMADKLNNLQSLTNSPPVSWSRVYIQGYFVWAREVVKPLLHHNRELADMLSKVFGQRFTHDGKQYPCILLVKMNTFWGFWKSIIQNWSKDLKQ